MDNHKKVLLCIDPSESQYVYKLRQVLSGCAIKSVYSNVLLLSYLEQEAEEFGAEIVMTKNTSGLILGKISIFNFP